MLKDADSSGMSSIALPAIGTGRLDYPPKTVAKLMYEAATTFYNESTGGNLNDIHFILYPNDQKVIQVRIIKRNDELKGMW